MSGEKAPDVVGISEERTIAWTKALTQDPTSLVSPGTQPADNRESASLSRIYTVASLPPRTEFLDTLSSLGDPADTQSVIATATVDEELVRVNIGESQDRLLGKLARLRSLPFSKLPKHKLKTAQTLLERGQHLDERFNSHCSADLINEWQKDCEEWLSEYKDSRLDFE